jgi:WD40 repeat protein/DNA-binding SARP family transcriptional activator/energy-coupling factor transporter ATP-binding protein EcfA2
LAHHEVIGLDEHDERRPMQIRVLGHLEVNAGDRPVALGGPKQRAVLAMLGLEANRTVTADRLAAGLWGEEPPASAAKVVQTYVWRLRQALADDGGATILTHGRGYELRVDPEVVDVHRLERLVTEAARASTAGEPGHAAREALALFRGEPLADLADVPFATAEIPRLEGLRETAAGLAIEADLAAGRHQEVLGEIDALLARNPLRERLHAQRMLALYRCGRQAEALESYRHARRTLVDEIGVEPGPELKRLHEAILRQDPALDVKPAAVELPRELDASESPPLMGREGELRRLQVRWQRAAGGAGSLVAIMGPDGSGKTRLAAALAAVAHREGAMVQYAAGAQPPERALAELARTRDAQRPTVLVLDDADRTAADVLTALRELAHALGHLPALVLATGQEAATLERLEPHDWVRLEPLDADAVRAIAGLYAPADADVPVEALLATSRGVARTVHEAAGEWARREAVRQVDAVAGRAAAAGGEARALEAELAGRVVSLQAARERAGVLGRADVAGPVLCPYKGLATFDIEDADCFFGREQLVARLVARLVGARLLGVVGPSGSGKSSVVRAGLLPALAAGALPGSERWGRALIRPGEHPMRELGRARLGGDRRIVLVVDQLEELFTACRDEHERATFVAALVRAVRDRGVAVVLAVRADFYGRCAAYPELAGLLGANHVLVGPMGQDELRRAIELPARHAGLRLEPGLADRLLADCEGEPGALPLLSSALLELWQQRDGRHLRLAAYERTGGVRGAVARLAEAAHERIEPDQQPAARRLLLRLIAEEGGAAVRRRVALDELGDDTGRVLDVLAESRLITVSEGSVEVAHEALVREWPRLRRWLDEDRDGRRLHRHLTQAAREWREGGRDRAELYRGARLASALEWRAEHEPELNAVEQQFLDASRVAGERARRRLRLVLAGVIGLLVIATVAAVAALDQRGQAREQARAADAQRLGTQARSDEELDRALLVAREGVALDDAPATRDNLLAVLRRAPAATAVMRGDGDVVNAVALHPDGRTLAVGDDDGTVFFFDTATRRRLGRPHESGLTAAITSLAFSPDGSRLASSGVDDGGGFVDLFDGRSREHIGRLGVAGLNYAREPRITTFSPDSRVVAAAAAATADSSYVLRWDARTGNSLVDTRMSSRRAPALFGFVSARRVVTAAQGATIVRDAATLRPLRRFPAARDVTALSFAAGLVAFGAGDGSVRLLDLRTGALRTAAGRHEGPVVAMRFSPRGHRLVTAGDDERLIVWDLRGANAVETIAARGLGLVQDLAVSRDGRTAYSAGRDGTVIAWDLTGDRRWERRFDVRSAALLWRSWLTETPDGSQFAIIVAGGGVDLFDGGTLRRTGRFRPARGRAVGAALAPDGGTLAVTSAEGTLELWDTRARRRLVEPQIAHAHEPDSVTFSGDGHWLVTGDVSIVRLWDARRRTTAGSFVQGGGSDLSLSPDGTMLAVTALNDRFAGGLEIRSVPSLEVIRTVPVPAGTVGRFAPDGRSLVYGDREGRVWTLDTRTWKPTGRPFGEGAWIRDASVSPDGRLLATTSTDGTGRLWDLASRRPIGAALSGASGEPIAAGFIRGGTHLAVIHEREGVAWDVRPASWARHACAVAGRTLTRAEWASLLPGRDYEPACVRP